MNSPPFGANPGKLFSFPFTSTANIEEMRKKLEMERQKNEEDIGEIHHRCDIKQGEVNEERIKYTKMKKEAASRSYTMQSDKPPAAKVMDAFFQREQQKELEVINVRLENIKLTNQLKKKEQELKAKEELGEGLHMIDFEQLKIENQTYNEKIEERNEVGAAGNLKQLRNLQMCHL